MALGGVPAGRAKSHEEAKVLTAISGREAGSTLSMTFTVAVLEAMRILGALGAEPRRTIRAALWSGEERGLLGSETYAVNPVYPAAKTVANLTLYYEKYGWQTRLSTRYRSEFLGEISGFANGRTLRHTDNGDPTQVLLPFPETIMHLLHVLSRLERVRRIGRDTLPLPVQRWLGV